MSDEIRIRLAEGRSDCDACVPLQREVWGLQDLEITSALQFLSGIHGGALLHLAENPDGELIGFAWAFPAIGAGGRAELHSDMLAVAPQHQGRGIGGRLKWAQRQVALERGLTRISWTFDPLQARNAHLNLRRLGALAVRFYENFYGLTTSPLHHGLPTDRLLVRWDLQTPRVLERLAAGEPAPLATMPDAPHVNEVKWQAGWPVSQAPDLTLDAPELLLEVPPEWDVLNQAAPRVAQDWHEKVRAALRHYLSNGYVAADFVPSEDRGRRRPLYVLQRG
jgi:chorismate synthase